MIYSKLLDQVSEILSKRKKVKTKVRKPVILAPLYYLAGPYTHKDQQVMEERELAHIRAAALLLNQGVHTYCPIAETANIAKHGSINDTGWEFWRDKDLNQLNRCDGIYVLMLDGWKESRGVRGEVKFALKNKMPIWFLDSHCKYLIETNVLKKFGVKSIDELND